MNVLSLFDGMSCGRIALERAGIPVASYYASEIDKYAIKVSQANYPDQVQLGCITKHDEWELPEIDLLIAGFPCQAWSLAGKQKGDNDPRGALVHDLIKIWKKVKPKYFMFENVKMKKEFLEYINDLFGVEPVLINSALVSAQNRNRYYWTNIPDVEQPEDKGILLKDIVIKDAANPTVCMHNLYGGFGETKHRTFTEKCPTIRTAGGGGHIPSLLLSEKALAYMDRQVKGGRNHWDFKHHTDIRDAKSATIVANFFKGVPYNVLKDEGCIRGFHPIECERLQTIPDNYTDHVSKTQRLKVIGNGWTVDVIAHIFKGLK